jgi:hypothetical protein
MATPKLLVGASNQSRRSRPGQRRHSFPTVGPLLVVLTVGALLVSPAASSGTTGEPWQAAPTSIVQEVTNVPESVFDAVSLQSTVSAPVLLHGQPQLEFDGKPGIFYMASEPCPYCAAERWAFVIALARFGSWSHLGITQSASDDVDPSTQTFTFSRATYSSPYVALRTREYFGTQKLPNGDYSVLQRPTPAESSLYKSYTSSRYFPANPSGLPFVDFGNRVVVSSSSYDPYVLHGLSREQIAADLNVPTSPATQDIIATANYLSAAACLIDGDRPTAVCQSPGVLGSAHFVERSYGYGVGACVPAKNGQSICGETNSFTKG